MRARDLRGRGAGIEDDGLAVADQSQRRLRDAHLFRVMLQLLDAERLVGLVRTRQRAAVGARQGAG